MLSVAHERRRPPGGYISSTPNIPEAPSMLHTRFVALLLAGSLLTAGCAGSGGSSTPAAGGSSTTSSQAGGAPAERERRLAGHADAHERAHAERRAPAGPPGRRRDEHRRRPDPPALHGEPAGRGDHGPERLRDGDRHPEPLRRRDADRVLG